MRKTQGHYCSRACYFAHQRQAPYGPGGAASPHQEAICKQCGKAFRVSPRSKRPEYCSAVCWKESRMVTKMCPRCGKAFRVNPGTADRYNYCSLACRHASVRHVACKRCGRIFTVHGRKEFYCSEECRRPPVMQTCATCGKEFRIVPSDANRQFCSFGCYRRYTGETLPERTVRLALTALGIEFRQEYTPLGMRTAVDFYLPTLRTMLEIDGTYWHSRAGVRERDAKKTLQLQARGYRVVRLPDTPFAGEPTESTLDYLSAAISLCEDAKPQSAPEGLYPIQLSLPLGLAHTNLPNDR